MFFHYTGTFIALKFYIYLACKKYLKKEVVIDQYFVRRPKI